MGNCCQGMLSSLLPFFAARNNGVPESSAATSFEVEGDQQSLHHSPPTSREGDFLFDVFLSFRGEDTRKGFTSTLCEVLKAKGVHTFFDSETLAKGERVDKLFHYIQGSNIFVPIFSKRYADSKWCLKEIAEIVKCGRLVVPVFLDVDPTHVRHQTGPFESAFERHMSNVSHAEVSEWRDALKEIGEVSGFTPSDTAGRVVKELARPTFDVARFPVGLQDPIQDVMTLLDTQTKSVGGMVGIHGLGGIGKTTLAKAICNEASSRFEAYSFLSGIKGKEMTTLQRQLLSDVFGDNDVRINDADHGRELIKQRIRSKTVLIILDDVDDAKQVNALACCRDYLSPGSKVLLTTRARDVLTLSGLEESEVYELQGLSNAHSLQLFSYHAFGNKEPLHGFADLSEKVVSIAGGLPLALEVYGSLLFDKTTREEWIAMLEKMEGRQDKGIHERLKVSFDGLDEGEKEIFLDIACFFIGFETEDLLYMWRDCGFYPDVALGVLQHRSLIKFDGEHRLQMHDQIRDMGRQIVVNENLKEPLLRSRLWESEHITEALDTQGTTSRNEGIVLDPSEDYTCLSTQSFENMDRLRLLDASFVAFEGSYKHFPKKLKWLKWNGCLLDALPCDLYLGNVVALDLSSSKMTGVWSYQQGASGTKSLRKLKVLNLSWCKNLRSTPDFSCVPSLERLNLDYCDALIEVHESIGQLRSLVYLSMSYCSSVEELPESLCDLTSLQHLDLSGCRSLSTLPRKLGNLRLLKHFRVSHTGITSLPNLSNMENLLSLDSSSCSNLQELPGSIGCAVNLQTLTLGGCSMLQDVPDSMGSLKNLSELNLERTDIKQLPDCIINLKKLKRLNLHETQIEELPNSLGSLEQLESLSVNGCQDLVSLPVFVKWTKLQFLDMRYTAVEVLPENFESLTQLKVLVVEGCDVLRSLIIPSSVEEVTADQCPSLMRISASNSSALRKFSLSDCERLSELPPQLESSNRLEELNILNCVKLGFLPPLPPSLKRLSLRKCPSLATISEGISNLKSLEELLLIGCAMLVHTLPDLRNLNRLQMLYLTECDDCQYPPQLPSGLKQLCCTCCPSSGMITYFTNLKSLISLDLSGCAMHSVSGLQTLECLEDLTLNRCTNLSHIAQLPPSLKRLHATTCDVLETIADVSNCKSLEELDASYCGKLVDIGGLEKLSGMKLLKLQSCWSLSSGLLDRIMKESNSKDMSEFIAPGIAWQGVGGDTGVSFATHPKFFDSDEFRFDVSMRIIDLDPEYWKEGHVHTQLVVMDDGDPVLDDRVKPTALEEEEYSYDVDYEPGRYFFKEYRIRRERQIRNTMVVVSFGRRLQLQGNLFSRGRSYTSVSISVSEDPNNVG